MNKKAIFIAAAALALFACDTEKQLDQKAAETAVELSDVAVSGTPDYVDSDDGVAWFKEPPVLSWKGTGESLSYTVSLNGGEEITVQEGYTLPNETGVYDILFTATDVFGRSQYAQLAVGVDVTAPVIDFVNTSDSCNIGEAESFIDSVPEDTAISDEGSGLNLESRRGYWEDKEAVAAAKHGDVFNRIFTIADNVGRTASYSLPVTFVDPDYVEIDDQCFKPVKVIDFSEAPETGIDGITLTEELSWTNKDDLGLLLTCKGDKHADSKMTVTGAALPEAGTYDAIALTFTPRENYKPNFYVGDGQYGFEFSKEGNAAFRLGGWDQKRHGTASVGLKQGESNTIGFWEKDGQNAAWFSVLGNTLQNVSNLAPPENKTLLTVAESLQFGLHSDNNPNNGSTGSVSIEKITFYKAVGSAAEGE